MVKLNIFHLLTTTLVLIHPRRRKIEKKKQEEEEGVSGSALYLLIEHLAVLNKA